LWLPLLGAACGFRLAGVLMPEALFWGLLALFFLLLIACTDFEQYVIFDAMLLPFALAGLAAALLLGMPVPDHLLSGFLGGLAFLVLAILTRGGIGGGDVKLIAVLGLWFGPERLLNIVLPGLLLGGLAALFLLLSKKKKRQEAFAYGPYFCLAAIFFLLTEGT
ncbi:MAG: prepilin peptidase, partial [Selenomonadaceae bacterium]|nr:prepilin peptidase [Selenomonadaceae bacterium]